MTTVVVIRGFISLLSVCEFLISNEFMDNEVVKCQNSKNIDLCLALYDSFMLQGWIQNDDTNPLGGANLRVFQKKFEKNRELKKTGLWPPTYP